MALRSLLAALALTLVMGLCVACAAAGTPTPDRAAGSAVAPTAPPDGPAPLPPAGSTEPVHTSTAEPVSPSATPTVPTPSAAATATGDALAGDPIPVFGYEVVNEYPHDPDAWTQGLVIADGLLYESTGILERSSLRQVDLETGRILRLLPLPDQYYGEGVAVHGDRIYQLTWKAGTGFVYDRDSFELLDTFEYPNQGWGLTYDGEQFIMSDGTETLHFLDPETLAETGTVRVALGTTPVPGLNELEYVSGLLYANVWLTSVIVQLETSTGQVTGLIDLSGIQAIPENQTQVKILNGIAYDAVEDRLFVTGKFWPTLFEIKLVPPK